MRLFTAIPLPIEVKEKFADIARGKLPIPYVNTSNLHITLNFLGELDSDRSRKAIESWSAGLPEIKRMRIGFDKLTKFRQQIHMTVRPNPELVELQSIMRRHLASIGFHSSGSEYYAHVTIGNLHMDKVMNRERKIEGFPNGELEQLDFEADRIVLYESKLLLHHPQHNELAEYKLT
jgi:RNA 2',3'-cyclic 3'-phosphodiesterase